MPSPCHHRAIVRSAEGLSLPQPPGHCRFILRKDGRMVSPLCRWEGPHFPAGPWAPRSVGATCGLGPSLREKGLRLELKVQVGGDPSIPRGPRVGSRVTCTSEDEGGRPAEDPPWTLEAGGRWGWGATPRAGGDRKAPPTLRPPLAASDRTSGLLWPSYQSVCLAALSSVTRWNRMPQVLSLF